MALYLVTGNRSVFGGQKPGSTFEALIERDAEERAVRRGDIRVLERSTPALRPGSYRLPAGWKRTPQG
jgi:hypothetical protein